MSKLTGKWSAGEFWESNAAIMWGLVMKIHLQLYHVLILRFSIIKRLILAGYWGRVTRAALRKEEMKTLSIFLFSKINPN